VEKIITKKEKYEEAKKEKRERKARYYD